MSYFMKSGNTFRVATRESMDLHESLPAGNYVIKMDQFENLFLEEIDDFEIRGKIYGDLPKTASRILNTFSDRNGSTGVMLSGEKGSGKTLLAKLVSVYAAGSSIPTIVVNAPFSGDKFNSFLQMIEQPCIVLFDEFEKTYDKDQQQEILTLLDGVFPSRKLFVLTCNDKWGVDIHMRNRPGRIYYMMDFKGVTTDFIREYCEDTLQNKTHIESICKISSIFDQFNFDMLKALVEEMNRYDESPQESLQMLNTKPEFGGASTYDLSLVVNNRPVKDDCLGTKSWNGNPLMSAISLSFRKMIPVTDPRSTDFVDGAGEVTENWNWEDADFTPGDIKEVDAGTGKFVFINRSGEKLILVRAKEKTFNYFNAF